MKGLHLGKGDSYLEKVKHNASEFTLLGRGGGSEVILQTIQQGKPFYVVPGEDSETMEFFYILEGECVYEEKNDEVTLGPGDYFYLDNLEDSAYFKAVTDMKMLWYSTVPVFHSVSRRIYELTKVVEQVEEKDHYTYRHSSRVQEYSMRMARQLQLSQKVLENIYFAALFHDIGKINVPSEILNKPGRLTLEEFEILKKHSYDGAQMVKTTYYPHVSDIILQHHERLDGSGYPYGLKGDEIMLEAQIIGITDTYDAMTSDRIYRKGTTPEFAMAELRRNIGNHFKRELVEAFEAVLIADGVLPGPDLKKIEKN